MMEQQENTQAVQMPAPDPALKRLEGLVGTWKITGRTVGAKEDNISGWNTFEWLPGGFFLQQRIEMDFMGFKIQSLEIIGYNPATEAFSSYVYSNMSGTPLPYQWEFRDNALKIWIETAKFEGRMSGDGNSFSGGWRPEPGRESPENISYGIVGTRVK